MDEKIIENINKIKGQELKYKKLCEELNMPVKTSNSKKSQLKELSMYCDIQELEKPRRYIINEVYEEELEILKLLNSNNKYQIMFDAAIYQIFLNNNGESIYVSNMDILKLFQEVNENFSYACNKDNILMLDEDYDYMSEMGLTVYKILNQWTQRRLKSMENRCVIQMYNCYRLYKKVKLADFEYIDKWNVPIDSDANKICQDIYRQAIDEIMPENWGIEFKDKNGNIKSGKFWVPEGQWKRFQSRVQELVKIRFNNGFDDLKPITRIDCPATDWLKKKSAQLCKQLNAITEINEESCRKALDTKSKQLDNITQMQRKQFIEINMKANPPFLFKEKLKEFKENNEDK